MTSVLFLAGSTSATGGVQSWLSRVATGLGERGVDVRVAVTSGPVAHRADLFIEAHPELDCTVVDGAALSRAHRIVEVRRCIDRHAPDVFIPLVVADGHLAACSAAAAGRTRYLLTLHGVTPGQMRDVAGHVGCAAAAASPSMIACRHMVRLGLAPERVHHIPNGADAAQSRVPAPADRPLRILMVGRLTQADKRARDVMDFAHALQRSGTPFDLTIAGDGPEADTIRAGTETLPVRMLGSVPLSQLYEQVYPQADVLIHFASSESFGIAIVEAMQHGVVPVVADYLGRRAEGFAVDGETAQVFPIGDVEAAAARVTALHQDRQRLARLSIAARALVSDRYAWRRSLDAWHRLVSETAAVPLARRTWSHPLAAQIDAPSFRMVHAARLLRRRVLGVPASMVGGEEWPWLEGPVTEADRQRYDALARELDYDSGASRGEMSGNCPATARNALPEGDLR